MSTTLHIYIHAKTMTQNAHWHSFICIAASQPNAGEGYGGVYIPVVGDEEGTAIYVVHPPTQTQGACLCAPCERRNANKVLRKWFNHYIVINAIIKLPTAPPPSTEQRRPITSTDDQRQRFPKLHEQLIFVLIIDRLACRNYVYLDNQLGKVPQRKALQHPHTSETADLTL